MADNVVINYKVNDKEVKDTTESLEEMNKETVKSEKSAEGLSGSFAGLGDVMSAVSGQLDTVTGGLATLTTNATGATKGLKGLTTGFKALDIVLKASVIGLIVAAVATLAVNLTKTAKGTDFLRKAFATLQGVANGLLDVIINIDQVFSRNLNDVFSKNVQIAQQLSRIYLENARNTRTLSREISELNQEFELSNQRADDATLSLREQNEEAIRSADLAVEIAQRERSIAFNRLNDLQAERLALRARNEVLSEDFSDSLTEAENAFRDANTNLLRIQQESATRIRQIDQDTFELRRDFLLDFTDTNKAIAERIIADTTRPIEERSALLQKITEDGNAAFQRSVEEFEKQAGQRIEINKLLAESDAEVIFNYVQGTELSEIETTRFLELLRERRVEQQDLAEAERDLNDEREERRAKQEDQREKDAEAERERQQEVLRLSRQTADQLIAIDNEVAQSRRDLSFQSAEAAIMALNLIANKNKGFAVAALALEKSLAIADIIINLQKELAGIASNAAANPANAVTFGAAGVAQFSALATAAKTRAAISTGVVIATGIQEAGAFKDGVIDLQGPGTATSDSIPARLSKGESVMTALETSRFKPTFTAIRDGLADPDVLNRAAQGDVQVVDNFKVVEVPTQQINIDRGGFLTHTMNGMSRTTVRRQRYAG